MKKIESCEATNRLAAKKSCRKDLRARLHHEPCAFNPTLAQLIGGEVSWFTDDLRGLARMAVHRAAWGPIMDLATAGEADHHMVGRFITVDGTRLHHIDRGSGPPVVFLHGNGSMIGDFVSSGIMECSAAGHRVVAFDRPGFGYSERPLSRKWGPLSELDCCCGRSRAWEMSAPSSSATRGVRSLPCWRWRWKADKTWPDGALSGYYYPARHALLPIPARCPHTRSSTMWFGRR